MDKTTSSRKMLNRHRFRPHLVNSTTINTSQRPVLHHLETNSRQLIDFKVQSFISPALSPQTKHVSGEPKQSVVSRLDLGGGEADHRPKDPQFFRCVDDGYFTLSTANSSPAPRAGEGEVLVDECYPESPPDPQLDDEVKCEPRFSFAEDDACSAQSGLPPKPVNIPECWEEEAEGVWNIGHPIFESTFHSFAILDEAAEQSEGESGEAQKDATEASPSADSGVSTSWESTILPHVQVRSKVVVPDPVTLQPRPAATFNTSPRSINFKEAYWKQKKDQYVNLVRRHYMLENPRADHDAMSDLVDLMRHVDKQSAGSRSDNWQHPSDLTRRNYRAQFGNGESKMSLQEWEEKNGKKHKRFANVPKMFKRSPCL